MTIKQMQYFASVSRSQNMTKSAEELFVSQPTLSVAIKEIEKEVGAQLFYRKGTHVSLTEAGGVLYEEVSRVLSQYDQMEQFIRSGSLNRKYVRFGFSTIVGNAAAPRICDLFLRSNPDMRIQAVEDIGSRLLTQLDNYQLDAVLTGSLYAEAKEWTGKFDTYGFMTAGLVLCTHRANPLAGKGEISLSDLAGEPIIMLNDSFPIARNIESIFLKFGVTPNVIIRTSQLYTIESFISTGTAIGFLPAGSAGSNTEIVRLRCREFDELLNNSLSLYWKRSGVYPQSLKRFIASVKEAFPPDR